LNNDSLKRNSKATCAATVFEAELEDVSFTDETDEKPTAMVLGVPAVRRCVIDR
jgi:hypothetical protein